MISTDQNFFQLFDLSASFEVDIDSLSNRYRELQNETHPDRFSAGTEQEKLLAVQLNSYLNEAYATLKSPLQRAGYLLKLQDVPIDTVSQEDLGMDLLLEQMQLREKLAELPGDDSALPELEKMKRDVQSKLKQQRDSFAADYSAGVIDSAKRSFHEMQFLHKLLSEIEQGEENRLDY